MPAVPTPILRLVQPVVRSLVRLRVTPNMLTVATVPAGACAALLLGAGWLTAGGVVYLLAGVLDFFDGHVARASGTSSPGGAFLDSTCDRLVEVLIFTGMAVHFGGGFPLAVTVLALGSSFLVSYTRARGEALGVATDSVGLLRRPARIMLVGGAAVIGSEPLLLASLGFVVAAGGATAVTRSQHVLRALSERRAGEAARPAAWSSHPAR